MNPQMGSHVMQAEVKISDLMANETRTLRKPTLTISDTTIATLQLTMQKPNRPYKKDDRANADLYERRYTNALPTKIDIANTNRAQRTNIADLPTL